MKTRTIPTRRLANVVCAAAYIVLAVAPTASADDAEIFVAESRVAPNIMLVLDTSGSMIGEVTSQEPYDPSRDYIAEATGACANIRGRVLYRTSSQSTPPSCNTSSYFQESNLKCAAAKTALASEAGRYANDRYIQWRPSTSTTQKWRNLSDGYHTSDVECRSDNGVDGNLTASPAYPDANASGATPTWTTNSRNSYWDGNWNGGTSATLYSANYVAYYNQFRNVTRLGTRLEVMQQAARSLLNSVSNVNVGLMRYSTNTDTRNNSDGGGMVIWPVSPIDENREKLIELIDNLVPYGNTPLSETYYEAHQYFAGGTVRFGNSSRTCTAATRDDSGTTTNCSGVFETLPSIASARVGGTADSNTYASPANDSCQKNFIVYLTDGEPTRDSKANSAIRGLEDFSELVPDGCSDREQGACLGALAEYMYKKDLRDDIDGNQNVVTFFIGFGSAFGGTSNAAFQYLKEAGIKGGGDAYQAGDLDELTAAFTDIFSSIMTESTTLTAPTVAVNAFNRTRTLDDLYVSVFQPRAGMHWHGNVKRYGIDAEGRIIDRDNKLAVNTSTGFFQDKTSDVWSETNDDGPTVRRGGAAMKIPGPASRKVYTYIGDNPAQSSLLTTATNAFSTANGAITNDLLGITNPDGDPDLTKLVNWARGQDVKDEDGDGQTDDARNIMGDPMHAQPGVVIYGGTVDNPDMEDGVVYATTNDGYLHAIDIESGEELWAFLPREMLPRLLDLYYDENSAIRNYGLDGDIRVLKYDVNGDGIVTPAENDRVLLYFSTGRSTAASRYYALDVTDKDAPRFLWSLGPTELPGLGQAWSQPTFTRVRISDKTQNSQNLVLVFGGGYDPAEEGGAFLEENSVGNRIFMVDAISGALLWSAGNADSNDLTLERMTHSIPAEITVLDLNGDGYADRMYASDVAAQVWRFDVYSGNATAALVTGGVFASLGTYDDATHAAANTRRFYNAPDVAALQVNNGPVFFNIAIGSGYRGHPLNTETQDRFYALRDHRPFAKLTQQQYDDWTILKDSDLIDVTTDLSPQIPRTANGWKIRLDQPGGNWQGEKVLGASNTFQNTIFFTTYTPAPSAASNQCTLAVGSNRAYVISAFDASPRAQRDAPTPDPENPNAPPPNPSPSDRYDELAQSGIAPEVTFLFPEKDTVVCLSGVEVLGACTNFNSRLKTYWRESTAQ